MRFLLKLLAVVILAPLAVGAAAILAITGLIAIPLLWQELTARLASPPEKEQ